MSGSQILRVAVAGGDIVYDAITTNAAPHRAALLFLHGWTLDRRMWRRQLSAFAHDRAVLAPDRRGFGASTAPADLTQEPEDVARLLDHHCIERAIVVGMSQAWRVAVEFALRSPDRLAALVLQGAGLGAVPPAESDDAIPLAHYTSLVRGGRIDEMKALWLAHPLMRAQDDDARALLQEMLAGYDGRDLLSDAPALQDRVEAFASVSAPVLALTGANDTAHRRRSAHVLAAAFPLGEHAEVPAAGHLCNVCQAETYNHVLATFLQSHGL